MSTISSFGQLGLGATSMGVAVGVGVEAGIGVEVGLGVKEGIDVDVDGRSVAVGTTDVD